MPDERWLGRPGGDRLALAVLSYEFGRTNGDEYDDNWLIIDGAVEHAGQQWCFQDACLLTGELRTLAAWLRAFPTPADPELDFTEPSLEFHATDAKGSISVILGYEALPDDLFDEDVRLGDGATLTLEVTQADAARVARLLEGDLTRFPER